jgi:hypothetical protein
LTACARAPCGGLTLSLANTRVTCRVAGALWLAAERALVVADLHMEKGSAYAARGQLLPPFDTPDTLGRLEAEAEALDPAMIVFLGDSFHDDGGEARLTSNDFARLTALGHGRTLVWVLGNHDSAGPRALPGEQVAGLDLGGLAFIHAPAAGAARGEVAGHLHPCARVAGPGRSVRRRCFVTDGERMVLPAFGAYAGGLNIRDPAFRPLFPRHPLAAVLGMGAVHAVSWAALRGD